MRDLSLLIVVDSCTCFSNNSLLKTVFVIIMQLQRGRVKEGGSIERGRAALAPQKPYTYSRVRREARRARRRSPPSLALARAPPQGPRPQRHNHGQRTSATRRQRLAFACQLPHCRAENCIHSTPLIHANGIARALMRARDHYADDLRKLPLCL